QRPSRAGPTRRSSDLDLNGGTVTTSAGQSYAAVSLTADTMLISTASGAINLAGAVTGNGFALAVKTVGQTTFGGAVNGVDALSSAVGGTTAVQTTINV